MALRVWLPLNKDFRNQGLDEITVTTASTSIKADGPVGGCCEVTNTQRITFPSQEWMRPTNEQSFSIAMFVRVTTFNYIVAAGAFELRIADGNTYFRIGDGNAGYTCAAQSTAPRSTGVWYHLTGVWDSVARKVSFYVDGNLAASANSTVTTFKAISSTINLVYGGQYDICDVRLYDHALSAKEAREISKGLMLHYKLDDFYTGTTAYDCSGFGNHGTIVGSPTVNASSPMYESSLTFASGKYIRAGRAPMIKDAITVSLWFYMSVWSGFNGQRVISCTQTGGWNFQASSSKASFIAYASGSSAAYVYAYDSITHANIPAGWHHLVGTYDSNRICFYRDGVFGTSAATGGRQIGYHASNGVFIAAESNTTTATPTTPACTESISDVRIYGRALTPEDVAELYHTKASIDNKGNFYCGELKET